MEDVFPCLVLRPPFGNKEHPTCFLHGDGWGTFCMSGVSLVCVVSCSLVGALRVLVVVLRGRPVVPCYRGCRCKSGILLFGFVLLRCVPRDLGMDGHSWLSLSAARLAIKKLAPMM